jgi:molybdopterin-guanine dinucleotide biosynthesis protein
MPAYTRRKLPSKILALLKEHFDFEDKNWDSPEPVHKNRNNNLTWKHAAAPLMDNVYKTLGPKHSCLVQSYLDGHTEAEFFMSRNDRHVSTYCASGELRIPSNFNLGTWISENLHPYMMYSCTSGSGLITKGDQTVRVHVTVRVTNLVYEIAGDKDLVLEVEANFFNQGFTEKGTSIVWTFGENPSNLEDFNMPLNVRDPLPGAYPWMRESVKEFTARYIASKASILILLGPPGTGKTSLIKEIIQAAKTSAKVTYDTKLLFTDSFFANFMTDTDTDILVLEDADTIMGAREDGNTMMHKFLNASDGLISLENKKIIFTTNLPSVNSIDHALLRKGRCFEVVVTRSMSFEEAKVVVATTCPGIQLENRTYTLAELANMEDQVSYEGMGRKPFRAGFTS